MYFYESKTYGQIVRSSEETLADACGVAWADLEFGDAWPYRILQDEVVLWEQRGPLGTRESLRAFASGCGVTLRDA